LGTLLYAPLTVSSRVLYVKHPRRYFSLARAPPSLFFFQYYKIAIIIEVAIANYLDMGILLVIQFVNASISFYETSKAGNAIAALKSSLKPTTTCKPNGKWAVMDAGLLVPGITVLLGSGSAIPADCRVNHSEIDVDQAALTGESLPITFYKGDSCKMGSTDGSRRGGSKYCVCSFRAVGSCVHVQSESRPDCSSRSFTHGSYVLRRRR
jgi:magnesium-transporting ATPase (P-type)